MDKSMNSLMEAKAVYEEKLKEITYEFIENEIEPLRRDGIANVSFDVTIKTHTIDLFAGAKAISKVDYDVKLILE